MKRIGNQSRIEMNAAKRMWGLVGKERLKELQSLLKRHRLSISEGDILLLDNHWYVTHSGLLRCAHRHHCSGITTTLQARVSDPAANRWVFRAIVYGPNRCKSFVAYGDADPSNVSSLVQGAEMRVAETRAVNRALRKAYGIGLCSFEELGALPSPRISSASSLPTNGCHSSNANGQPRLRDQLCLLIRQYNLDANLVKVYAADFCGTETLRGASRELVESFIVHLSNAAKENRDALVCELNSYSQPVEAR